MSIAFDATSSYSTTSWGSGTLTWAHTCTGSNRALVVSIVIGDGTCTGVTYNGVAMTLVQSQNAYTSWYQYQFYLNAPASGTHNIVASFAAGSYEAGYAVSYTGVNQVSTVDNKSQTTGSSASASNSLTPITASSWIVGHFFLNSAMISPTNITVRVNGSSGYLWNLGDSNTPVTGSYTMTETLSTNTWGVQMLSLAPAAGSSVNSNFLMFM